ncbi:capsular polysaccharide biosynthesis protein [Rhizobium sp. TRM95111]|uniref:capsular polysaccharide biosynthesis protein n=1 Tax=Rhizobium alarense TaxID=2846851 RepID=UPI001F36542F|nr:capsular polysaccharide biosynthesis protein [Rhizobium alarense]MCF3640950.1 capsular polysaccharide biosynthesis protein [Rhizobium alarense]
MSRTYAVMSLVLWRIRSDIETVLGARVVLWPLADPFRIDGFIGWGQRPSGLRAARLAGLFGKERILLEDGFLKGFSPGAGEPSHSFVVDRRGIYFDARGGSDIDDVLAAPVTQDDLARASEMIGVLRANRLSKYNNSPLVGLREAGIPQGRPYVLLVDQVAGDASIPGALASHESFAGMLRQAMKAHPASTLVVRTHPAAGDRSLLRRAARDAGIEIVVPPRMNPWPLLEEAECVYTVSSQLGFEALMAGRPVHCFGVTYYSGRGVTTDWVAAPKPRAPLTVEEIFAGAFLRYSRYLDLHDRTPCSLERAVEQMLTVRDQRARLEAKVYTGGLSPWKRRALAPFLVGMQGEPIHCRDLAEAEREATANGAAVAIWGSDRPLPRQASGFRIEDGFIRSRGLGVDLAMPSSVVFDGEHVYYDARGESRLEALIAGRAFDAGLRRRAAALRQQIIERGVSKYNVGAAVDLPQVEAGRLKILVPGQVEKDASIRFGSPWIKTNADLVRAVRVLYPDAFLVYKEHPDVTSGVRSGGQVPDAADEIVRTGDIMHWIGWADRIETMTSLTGFEALIRGKAVGVHGMPFYAGWGLTEDRHPIARRNVAVDMDTLVAATLIAYPLYVHPVSRLPCRPEDLVADIAAAQPRNRIITARLGDSVARVVNRMAVAVRDRRLG